MNKTILKTLIMVLTVSLLTAGVTTLTSCKAKETKKNSQNQEATVKNSQNQNATVTDATGGTVVIPEALPAVATGTMTINGETVTAFEFDFYYYNIYSSYAQYAAYGAVPTVAADGSFDLSAACDLPGFESLTWGDYLMQYSQRQLQDTYIFADYAKSAGMVTTADDQIIIDDFFAEIQSYADQLGLSSDEYLKTMYGENATKDAMTPIVTRFLLADQYIADYKSSFVFTTEELQTFYTENQASYQNIDIPTVRHILYVATVGVAGSTDATTEELAAAKTLADAALAKVTTYDDMVAVGDAAMADGTAKESSEYTFAQGEMVAAFEAWSFDAARMPGDTAIVQTEYGYHVMYFVSSQKDWEVDAKASLTEEKLAAYLLEQEALPQYKVIQN